MFCNQMVVGRTEESFKSPSTRIRSQVLVMILLVGSQPVMFRVLMAHQRLHSPPSIPSAKWPIRNRRQMLLFQIIRKQAKMMMMDFMVLRWVDISTPKTKRMIVITTHSDRTPTTIETWKCYRRVCPVCRCHTDVNCEWSPYQRISLIILPPPLVK